MSNDDAYQEFQCHGSFWQQYHINISHADGGNIFLGMSRIVSFILFFSFNWYNRILLSKKAGDNVNVIKGLVLPSYFTYIYIYIFLSLFTGILDLIIQKISSEPDTVNVWLIPVETGLYHWLYEGLAFFLMRYGAGVKAIYRSLSYSGIWGAVTFVVYFLLMCILTSQFGFVANSSDAYSVFVTYDAVLLAFYLAFLVVPIDHLYRRPALVFYARFNVIYYVLSIVSGTMLFEGVFDAVCPCSVIVFVFVAVLQPVVIFKTLQIDSQYWQGLTPGGGSNPLSDVWDHVGLDTAKSMAEDLETFDHSPVGLPILHFGLINFDAGGNYVAGGFSRVYFGKLRGERVAFKILFAMELTPGDVKEFYKEATILYALRHANVVQCRGVCVMPPSLTLVLEFCKYGSLFDFLYKPRKAAAAAEARASDRASSGTMLLRQTNMNRLSEIVGGAGGRGGNAIGSSINSTPRAVDISAHTSLTTAINPLTPSAPAALGSLRYSESGGGLRDSERDSTGSGDASKRMSAFSVHTVDSYAEGGAASSVGGSERSGRESMSSHMSISSLAQKASKAVGSGLSTLYNSTAGTVFPRAAEDSASAPVMHPLAYYADLPQRLRMMRDCVNAIAFLHSQGYMHCDIKSLNFLVTADLVVKLADMGEARLANSPPKRDIPPIPARNWAPPEVLAADARADSYTVKSDIYGLCIVLSELILLELPFGDTPERVSVQRWHAMLTVEHLRPVLPDSLPPRLRKTIEQGWLSYPAMRPSAEDLLAVVDESVPPPGPEGRHNTLSIDSSMC